jgi:hypothetical protein
MRSFADSLFGTLLASLLLQSGVAGVLAGRSQIGGALVSAGSAILIIRLKAAGILSRERVQAFLKIAVSAVLIFGFGMQLYTLYRRSHRGRFADVDTPEKAAGVGTGKYRGVILWTDLKPHSALVVPRPSPKRGLDQSKQTLSIPFDGVYWFFQFPDRQPPKNSYSLRGNPSKTAFRSTDVPSIQMEARQNFASPIDLSCCSRVGVEIANADRYPGSVWLELILGSESFGRLPVTSAAQRVTESEWGPTSEALNFPIPASTRTTRFDSATVRFIRYGRLGVSSPRMAIERFTLVPR